MTNLHTSTFKDVEFNKNLCVVVDVRRVRFSDRGDKCLIDNVGWTICPIFTANGYVKSGVYQFPIFKGSVPLYIIEETAKNDP